MYHSTGLPLYFTIAYDSNELANLNSPAAQTVLLKYRSNDTFVEHFSKIEGFNSAELAEKLNINKEEISKSSSQDFKSAMLPESTSIIFEINEDYIQTLLNKSSVVTLTPQIEPIAISYDDFWAEKIQALTLEILQKDKAVDTKVSIMIPLLLEKLKCL